ncbi:MAG: MMPL family transporter [Bacilli bacterium]|nr:MMPL family transporter [Bacilli bacterium]
MFRKFKVLIIIVFALISIVCAILIPFVNINYDNSSYLPVDSKAKAGLELLESEFGSSGYLLVMVEDITSQDEINDLRAVLAIDNVNKIDYRVKEDKVLFQIVLEENDHSVATQETVSNIITLLKNENYKYYMSGQSYLTYHYNQMIKHQLPKIILLVIPIVLLILVVMTTSYIEPLLFLIVIGIAIVLNMGTNIFLPNVSYLTYSISPVLQLALCMDYSIILLSRYRHYKKQNFSKNEAINKAWKTSLVPILSSSLTTVAGFVAIMFMKYRIGFDVGIVLSKGVLLSLVTVIFLLPVLILLCDKLMERTQHRSLLALFKKRGDRVDLNGRYNKFIYRARYIIPGIAVVVIGLAIYFQLHNKFIYSDIAPTYDMKEIKESRENIKDNFGLNNQVVILLDNEYDPKALLELLGNLKYQNDNYITSIYAYTQQYTKDEIKEFLKDYDIESVKIDLLFDFININNPVKTTVSFQEIAECIDIFGKFKIEYEINELKALLNQFVEVGDMELALVYQLMGVSQTSVASIIVFFDTPYSFTESSVIFNGLLSGDELQAVYATLDEVNLSLFQIIGYYNNLFNTDYDKNTMFTILGGLVNLNDLGLLYSMAEVEAMNIKDLITIFTAKYDENAMKLLLADLDDAKIANAYQALNSAGTLDEEGKISIGDFVNFVLENYAPYLSEEENAALQTAMIKISYLGNYHDKIKMIETISPFLEQASVFDFTQLSFVETINKETITSQFINDNYQRIILAVDLDDESEKSFGYFEKMISILEEETDEYYLISSTSTIMTIKDTSNRDYIITTVISIGLIFLIIALSFKSFLIPIILIIVIEGAIFINMAIPSLVGNKIIFMGYLIVGCIQLGATIDYGILYADRYLEHRKNHNRLNSINNATRDSLPTIMTSGLILFCAGVVLSTVSSIPVISMLGRLIGIGGLVSVISILFFLPQIFLLTDRWFLKKVSK